MICITNVSTNINGPSGAVGRCIPATKLYYLFVLPSRPASVNFQIYHVTVIIVASCCFSFCRSDWFNADFMVTLRKKLTSAKFVWRAFKVVMG